MIIVWGERNRRGMQVSTLRFYTVEGFFSLTELPSRAVFPTLYTVEPNSGSGWKLLSRKRFGETFAQYANTFAYKAIMASRRIW